MSANVTSPEEKRGADRGREHLSAMSVFFSLFICAAVLVAAFSGRMRETMDASFESAKSAVMLAISMIGIMAFWLGLVRVLEAGGLMFALARLVKPVMTRLFSDVPADHPAMGAMLLNISANMLGLGNAATPFGLKAMQELNKLNMMPGVATNAMCLFLAINTSSVTLLPLGVIGLRAAAGSLEPAAIFLPSLIATSCSTIAGIAVALWLARRDVAYREMMLQVPPRENAQASSGEIAQESDARHEEYSHLRRVAGPMSSVMSRSVLVLFVAALVYQAVQVLQGSESLGQFLVNEVLSFWLMPFLMILIVAYGLGRGVKVYEAVVEGAKQGVEIAIRIIPFLVAILVAIAVFRASGAMELLAMLLNPITSLIGMPAEVVPMAVLRPLSGSGAFAVLGELVNRGPDSYSAFLASTIQGSTETTFYVLAVYFGSIGVVRIRHALAAGIAADIVGVLSACVTSAWFYR